MRAVRRAGRLTRDILLWLAMILYVSGGAALLVAALGYLFAVGYHGESVGFVYGLAMHALRVGILLLGVGLCVHLVSKSGAGRR